MGMDQRAASLGGQGQGDLGRGDVERRNSWFLETLQSWTLQDLVTNGVVGRGTIMG